MWDPVLGLIPTLARVRVREVGRNGAKMGSLPVLTSP